MTTHDAYVRGRDKMRRIAESGELFSFSEREINGKAFAKIETETAIGAIDLPLALLGHLTVDIDGSLTMGTYSDGRAHLSVLLVGPLEAMETMQQGAEIR